MSKIIHYGVDLSKHQKAGKIDFNALKKAGIEFVILRAGFGMYVNQKDSAFDSHYYGAIKAGLKVGAYHYSYARTELEAAREAEIFLRWIRGKKLEYPIAFDLEDGSQKYLSRTLLTAMAHTFLTKTEKAGYYSMLYTNPAWARSRVNLTALRHFDLWLACYTSVERRNALFVGKPQSIGIWQYTDNLQINGAYKKGIDGDIAYKDYATIIRKAGLNNL